MIGTALFETTSEKIDRLDLVEYLAGQTVFPKLYHQSKTDGEERIAFGSVVILPFVPILPEGVDPSIRFYGSVSFPSTGPDLFWSDFPPAFFFLPAYEIRQTDEETILYTRAAAHSKPPSPPLSLEDSFDIGEPEHHLSKEEWNRSVSCILAEIDKKKIEKAVLSRRTRFPIDGSVHPFTLLKQLTLQAESTSPFALQTGPNSLFLGSSPEMLYRREGNKLLTEAIAGTRRRGREILEDLLLSEELLLSLKDRSEIGSVKKFLKTGLTPLSEKVRFSKRPKILQTETVQHLRYDCSALLRGTPNDAELLKLLHPTPAVNGTPTEAASALIRALEPHERGLYAGSIGWISPAEASFTVAIRSGLIRGDSLLAFAGAGIVQGSDPLAEWEELDHKLSHWRQRCRT